MLSLVIAGVAWAVSGVPTRFAQVLVLATPCPLLIAAPVAYIAGTGRLAAAGVLIKAQDVLENLGRVTQVFFDKTGTLTVKQPQVVRVEMLPGAATRLNEDHVLMMAGAVESYSVHILSKRHRQGRNGGGWPDCASGSRMVSAYAPSRRPAGPAMEGSIRSSRTSMKTPAKAFPAR